MPFHRQIVSPAGEDLHATEIKGGDWPVPILVLAAGSAPCTSRSGEEVHQNPEESLTRLSGVHAKHHGLDLGAVTIPSEIYEAGLPEIAHRGH